MPVECQLSCVDTGPPCIYNAPCAGEKLMVRCVEVAAAAAASVAAPWLDCVSAAADANRSFACIVLDQLLCCASCWWLCGL